MDILTAGAAGSRTSPLPFFYHEASVPQSVSGSRHCRPNCRLDQRRVTVRGKQYWRVQTPGFATREGARSNAETIRDKLALQDVWIIKRQGIPAQTAAPALTAW